MDKRDPTIKVTFLGKGWGVRCFTPDGKLNDEHFVRSRLEIGPACRDLLRWWDKMGGVSQYASKSRHRRGLKEIALRRKEEDGIINQT